MSVVAASGRGYALARRFGDKYASGVRVWAVEGAGPDGAGLARYLSSRGEALRLLLLARRGAVDVRRQALVQKPAG